MPSAKLRHPKESFESLLRRFKKSVEKADIMNDLRKKEFFEKPSAIRKRERAASKKRAKRHSLEGRQA